MRVGEGWECDEGGGWERDGSVMRDEGGGGISVMREEGGRGMGV